MSPRNPILYHAIFLVCTLIISASAKEKRNPFDPSTVKKAADPIEDEFIVIFTGSCVESKPNNVITDFLDLFSCYSQNHDSGMEDQYEDIGDRWIVVDKNSDCLSNDDTEINFEKYCLSEVMENGRLELDGSCKLISQTGQTNSYEQVNFDEIEPNVDIIIMDTGIDFSHPDFKNFNHETIFDVTGASTNYDWHGTAVAGVICGEGYGWSSTANGGFVKASEGSGINLVDVRFGQTLSDPTVATAINGYQSIVHYLYQSERKAVVNYSWGRNKPCSQTENTLLGLIEENGGYQVASAGNHGIELGDRCPSGNEHVITVGGLDALGSFKTDTTNYGPNVDIYAKSEQVKTAKVGGGHYSNAYGTSFAAPKVAGVVYNYLVARDRKGVGFNALKSDLIGNAWDWDGTPRLRFQCKHYFGGSIYEDPVSQDLCEDYIPSSQFEQGSFLSFDEVRQLDGSNFIRSKNRKFKAMMNGNTLEVRNACDKVIWTSPANNGATKSAALRQGGQFWIGAWGCCGVVDKAYRQGAKVEIRNNGNLVAMNEDQNEYWSSFNGLNVYPNGLPDEFKTFSSTLCKEKFSLQFDAKFAIQTFSGDYVQVQGQATGRLDTTDRWHAESKWYVKYNCDSDTYAFISSNCQTFSLFPHDGPQLKEIRWKDFGIDMMDTFNLIETSPHTFRINRVGSDQYLFENTANHEIEPKDYPVPNYSDFKLVDGNDGTVLQLRNVEQICGSAAEPWVQLPLSAFEPVDVEPKGEWKREREPMSKWMYVAGVALIGNVIVFVIFCLTKKNEKGYKVVDGDSESEMDNL